MTNTPDHAPDYTLPAAAKLPTAFGDFTIRSVVIDNVEHAVITTVTVSDGAMVRVHSECLTGDVFSSQRCDCGEQLHTALNAIARDGNGVVIYLRGHEGRGIGFDKKIAAYVLQDQGADTIDANHQLGFPTDLRSYNAAVDICRMLNLTKIRLLTNNPEKYASFEKSGISTEWQPLMIAPNPHNQAYLATKRHKLGHRLGDDIPQAD